RADRLLVNIVGGTDLTRAKVHEIMTAVTDPVGRESHVIMGAVIDAGMKGQVSVCVLGTRDLGGRGLGRRRATANGRRRTRFARSGEVAAAGPAPQPAIPRGELFPRTETTANKVPVAQDEFAFSELESRGHF